MAYSAEKTKELLSLVRSKTFAKHGAWSSDEVEKIKALINEKADVTLVKPEFENTLFHIAILGKSSDLALFLLQQDKLKPHLNNQDTIKEARNTPLMLAIKTGLYDLAISFLEAGADPNIASGYDKMTPLHYAMGLLGAEYNEPISSLYQADNKNHEKLISLIHKLLEHGANVAAKNEFGSTPLNILDQRFTLEKDDDVFEGKVTISFPSFFNIADNVWKDYRENYKGRLYVLNEQLDDAMYDDNANKQQAIQAKIDELLKSASDQVQAAYQLETQYDTYSSNRHFFENEGDQKSLDEWREKYKSINPKFDEFFNLAFIRPPLYSCQDLLALSKKDEKFAHLNSVKAIHAESANPSGIINKKKSQDYGHSDDVNDYHSIIAGVCWHRNNFDNEMLIDNRNKFLSSQAGKNLVQQLHGISMKLRP